MTCENKEIEFVALFTQKVAQKCQIKLNRCFVLWRDTCSYFIVTYLSFFNKQMTCYTAKIQSIVEESKEKTSQKMQ